MNKYTVIKKNNNELIINTYDFKGYNFYPKNKIMQVDSMVIVKPSLIIKIIKKNIKKKLNTIMRKAFLLFEESEDRDYKVKELLKEINEFKSKIRHDYLNYLPKEYIKEIIAKIRNIEKEIMEDFPSSDEKQWGMYGNKRSR